MIPILIPRYQFLISIVGKRGYIMNHIYKVIWNHAKHCYTVVSEIAKNHSTNSVTKKKVSIAAILAVGMLSGFSPMVSGAADTIVYDKTETSLKSINSASVGKNAIALGEGASAVDDSIAIGNGAQTQNGTLTNGHSVALGNGAVTGAKSTSIGDQAKGGREGTITIGANANNGALYATIVGTDSSINYGSRYSGAVSTVIGSKNNIKNDEQKYSGVASSILGTANTIENSNGVTIQGTGNTVTGAYKDMKLSWLDGVKLLGGDSSVLKEKESGAIAIIGGANTISNQTSSTVIGFGNTLEGKNSAGVFTGGSHNTLTNVSNSLVMGDNNKLTDRKNVISLGNNNTVTADDAVAIGNGATVEAKGGVAIGVGSLVNRVDGSPKGAFAPDTILDANKFIWTATAGAVSVGNANEKITRRITNVAAGTYDTDAVNVAQLKKALESIDVDAGAGIKVEKITNGEKTTYKISTNIVGKDTPTDTTTVTTNQTNTGSTGTSQGTTESVSTKTGNTVTVSTETKATSFGADDNQKADVKPGGTLNINGDGSNILTSISTSDNSSSIKVELKKDITVDSVTAGDTSISTKGLTIKDGPSITKTGIDGGNQKVTGVAAGEISSTSKDAVNGSQLFATNQQVAQNAQSINKLGNRINKVGAGAAALAALHPLDFDPDDKWDFAAGYGNYNGENAAAIGAYYRPNEDTMFSVGGSFGNGENMVNAGVSLKLGQGNHVSTSKVAMAKEIKNLRKELEGLKSALLDVNAGKKLDTSKLQLFPDVPKNHWAYEYVSTLKGNGALTGYPDGEFKGDRPMTRYEFATMLYKAMLEGATLSDRILKEFAPELERFTVDTVHQDKDGKPTVERVRTVKAEK